MRCPLRQHVSHIAGPGQTLDRRGDGMQHQPARTLHKGRRIIGKSRSDLQNQGLHFRDLRVILNNVQVGTRKMNNVQDESRREQKKTRRRVLMIEIARDLIAANGLGSLKVGDVAEAADCSIGSVYNEFGDFDGLILTVNRETVLALTARLTAVPDADPIRQLHGLAETYLAFAVEHANLLRSLFEHRMEQDRPFPEDILRMVMEAFALMYDPLIRLMSGRDPEQIALQARMMFSAVHGIISLGLEERMVAVPPEKLRGQVAEFVDTYLAGLGIGVAGPD